MLSSNFLISPAIVDAINLGVGDTLNFRRLFFSTRILRNARHALSGESRVNCSFRFLDSVTILHQGIHYLSPSPRIMSCPKGWSALAWFLFMFLAWGRVPIAESILHQPGSDKAVTHAWFCFLGYTVDAVVAAIH